MALGYKARRRWALVILLVGLVDRPSVLVELAIYVGLGFAWALPFRFIFRGIGQADPDAQKTDGQGPSV